jgi:hypothetical protein
MPVGALLLTYATIHSVRYFRCRRFPATDGEVVSKRIANVASGESGITFAPVISYSYTVAGTRFVSDRLYSICGSSVAKLTEAEQLLGELVAKPFVVHYNPTKPDDAYLRNGPPVAIVLPLCIGLIFTIYGIVYLFKP